MRVDVTDILAHIVNKILLIKKTVSLHGKQQFKKCLQLDTGEVMQS